MVWGSYSYGKFGLLRIEYRKINVDHNETHETVSKIEAIENRNSNETFDLSWMSYFIFPKRQCRGLRNRVNG